MLELRDRFGITVAGAHGELGTRMFRIGHIGYYDVLDITTALTAVETLLLERGAEIVRGEAVVARSTRTRRRACLSSVQDDHPSTGCAGWCEARTQGASISS